MLAKTSCRDSYSARDESTRNPCRSFWNSQRLPQCEAEYLELANRDHKRWPLHDCVFSIAAVRRHGPAGGVRDHLVLWMVSMALRWKRSYGARGFANFTPAGTAPRR